MSDQGNEFDIEHEIRETLKHEERHPKDMADYEGKEKIEKFLLENPEAGLAVAERVLSSTVESADMKIQTVDCVLATLVDKPVHQRRTIELYAQAMDDDDPQVAADSRDSLKSVL